MKNLLLVVCMVALTSCMSFSDRKMRPVRNSIEEQLPEIRLEKEFAISMGGGLFDILDIVTLNDADLSAMDHVDVAVYSVYGRGQEVNFARLNFEETLFAKNRRLTWETIVKVRQEEEQVWVLVGMDLKKDSLEAVAVFVLNQEELVLINVDGDMQQMLEFAMRPADEHRQAMRHGSRRT